MSRAAVRLRDHLEDLADEQDDEQDDDQALRGDHFMDVATLAELLRETAEHHVAFEKRAPKHDWWDWYAPYLDARQRGSTPEEASRVADRYMEDVRRVVAT